MFNENQLHLALDLIWRATWQAAALALIVLLLMMVARKQIAPRWRVILWSLPLCRLVLLVVPASQLSLFNWIELNGLPQLANATVFEDVQANPEVLSASNNLVDSGLSRNPDFPLSPISVPTAPQDLESPRNHATVSSIEARTRPNNHSENSATGFTMFAAGDLSMPTMAMTTLFLLWISGCGLSLGITLRNRFKLAKILSQATPLDRDDLNKHIDVRCRALGIRRPIQCWIIDTEIGPASLGILRPKILIPRSLIPELSTVEWVSIIDHELEHVRRFDAAFLLLGQIACCLHWFNPLAYWLAACVRTEMECAVDASMMASNDEQARKNYGNLLITLAIRRSRSLGLLQMADRRSNLKRRIEELVVPVRNSKLRGTVCLIVIATLMVSGLSDVARTNDTLVAEPVREYRTLAAEDEVQKPAASTEFELTIMDAQGQPIPQASIQVIGSHNLEPDWGIEGEFFKDGSILYAKPTEEGRIKMRLPIKAYYSFIIRAEGYGPYRADWTRIELPAQFTVELDPAHTVGGIIVDEKKNPIAGATVWPHVGYKTPPGDNSYTIAGYRTITDDNGKWSYAEFPEHLDTVTVEIHHAQFKPRWATVSAETFTLKAGEPATQTIVMEKGFTVSGRIVDSLGNPIQDALVRTMVLSDIRSTRSNADGVYELTGCDEGVAKIVVSAPGMAVDFQTIRVGPQMNPVDFTMQPGGHVRVRVLDEAGNPAPKARIFFQSWRGERFDYFELEHEHVNSYADENGVWEWNEAPLDEFKVDIHPPNGMALGRQSLIARDEEYVFFCPPVLTVIGRVIDAETKQPIQNFKVIPGVSYGPQQMNWVTSHIFEAKDGTFEYKQTYDYFAHLFKVQALGYLPTQSRRIKSNEGRVELTFELKKGADIRMQVLTPDGLPAKGARVALGIPGAQIIVNNGDIEDDSTYAQRTVVGDDGNLNFPPQSTPYQLVITHEAGFAHFKSQLAESFDLIQLTPWASASGTFRIAKQPLGGIKLELRSQSVHSYGEDVPNIFTHYSAVSNNDGSFRFDRVFPGQGRVQRSILLIVGEGAKEAASSTSLGANFVANQTTHLEFGLAGCPVDGTLVKPDSIKEPILWNFATIMIEPDLGMEPPPMPVPEEIEDRPDEFDGWYRTWIESDEGRAWTAATEAANQARASLPIYWVYCDDQGNFRVDDMPAGTYRLSVEFHTRPDWGRLRNYRFTVPESNADKGEAYSLGPLQLTND